ncbi:pseudouridine synthase [Treponema medium ATCC 700293]|uniref:Pseudouridine synthase n=2 Tax=Treponema medium TaxID=58231 RepID=A0AA87NS30_TREMD|nr:pseudouridine synthase [Treponema medium ATCC 700293]
MRGNNHFSRSPRAFDSKRIKSFDNGTHNEGNENNGKRTEYFNNGTAPEDNGKSDKQEMRLQVYLAHAGVASRRACEKIIAEGRVSVNETLVTDMGSKVRAGDTVLLDGKPVHPEARKCYVLLNKPAGFVCTLSDEKGRPTAADLLKETYSERLYNIGRLDMFSSGAILFTNDGDFAAKIEHPSAQIEKEYVIETTQDFPPELLTRFKRGIRVDGIFYKCRSAAAVNRRKLRIVLVEGKNREIRRVLDSFNCTIKRLVRVRIGNLELGTLKAGEFRDLTAKERQAMLDLAAESKNEKRKYTE